MKEIISANLKALMKKHGETQEQLAKIAGCSEPFINRVVNGFKIPSAETLVLIADHYRCSVDELIREKK